MHLVITNSERCVCSYTNAKVNTWLQEEMVSTNSLTQKQGSSDDNLPKLLALNECWVNSPESLFCLVENYMTLIDPNLDTSHGSLPCAHKVGYVPVSCAAKYLVISLTLAHGPHHTGLSCTGNFPPLDCKLFEDIVSSVVCIRPLNDYV